jgi:type I restriction enzyme, S subunit
VGYIDGFIFDEPLILLAEDGGPFGSATKAIAYRISGKAWVNNHAHVLRPRPGYDLDYCYFSLAIRPDLKDIISGSTRMKLNKNMAKKIGMPVPLAIEDQKAIAHHLERRFERVEILRAAVNRQAQAVEALPGALLRETFGFENR